MTDVAQFCTYLDILDEQISLDIERNAVLTEGLADKAKTFGKTIKILISKIIEMGKKLIERIRDFVSRKIGKDEIKLADVDFGKYGDRKFSIDDLTTLEKAVKDFIKSPDNIDEDVFEKLFKKQDKAISRQTISRFIPRLQNIQKDLEHMEKEMGDSISDNAVYIRNLLENVYTYQGLIYKVIGEMSPHDEEIKREAEEREARFKSKSNNKVKDEYDQDASDERYETRYGTHKSKHFNDPEMYKYTEKYAQEAAKYYGEVVDFAIGKYNELIDRHEKVINELKKYKGRVGEADEVLKNPENIRFKINDRINALQEFKSKISVKFTDYRYSTDVANKVEDEIDVKFINLFTDYKTNKFTKDDYDKAVSDLRGWTDYKDKFDTDSYFCSKTYKDLYKSVKKEEDVLNTIKDKINININGNQRDPQNKERSGETRRRMLKSEQFYAQRGPTNYHYKNLRYNELPEDVKDTIDKLMDLDDEIANAIDNYTGKTSVFFGIGSKDRSMKTASEDSEQKIKNLIAKKKEILSSNKDITADNNYKLKAGIDDKSWVSKINQTIESINKEIRATESAYKSLIMQKPKDAFNNELKNKFKDIKDIYDMIIRTLTHYVELLRYAFRHDQTDEKVVDKIKAREYKEGNGKSVKELREELKKAQEEYYAAVKVAPKGIRESYALYESALSIIDELALLG